MIKYNSLSKLKWEFMIFNKIIVIRTKDVSNSAATKYKTNLNLI